MRILIVDDNKDNLDLLETLLKGNGYEVVSAANGMEALEKLRANGFDIIVSDILMPVMDGFRLCRECKEDEKLKDIPFVFYTATYTDEKDEELALKVGADKFIRKPAEPEEFIKIIRGVIRDAGEGKISQKKTVVEEEKEVFKLYSERLVNKLEKKMLALEAEITERKLAEEVLGERVKELTCLYEVSQLVAKADASLDELLKGTVNLLPDSWQYPEITCARILIGDKEFRTNNYRDTKWKQSSEIKVRGAKAGVAEICYLEERPEMDEGPFLKEERRLITVIARHLGETIERKQADEMVRGSEEKYRQLFELGSDALFLIDVKTGKILDLNNAAIEMYGYSREEALQMKNTDFSAEPDKTRKATLESEKHIPVRYHRRKDGTTFPTDISVAYYTWYGKEVCVAAIRDTTERKRAEDELRKYRKHLEELVEERTKELRDAQEKLVRSEKLAVLGQLAGGMGHELRNPLGAIKQAAYFLNMALEEPEPEVKETLDVLEKEVATSERIISSLLEFARPKPPTQRKVNVNDVLQEALSRITVPENIEVISQPDKSLPAILADPDQLAQVFANIILNGIQAMPEGGRLVVKSEIPSAGWVAISVTDTGAGIPEENLGKLFEPLFTTKAKGFGLGLALTSTLVEGNGGTIEVQSEVGKGSTFTVRLPIGGGEEK